MNNDQDFIAVTVQNEAQLRMHALTAAITARPDSVSSEEVVRTARTFYDFLAGEPEPQTKIVGWHEGRPFYASDRVKTVPR